MVVEEEAVRPIAAAGQRPRGGVAGVAAGAAWPTALRLWDEGGPWPAGEGEGEGAVVVIFLPEETIVVLDRDEPPAHDQQHGRTTTCRAIGDIRQYVLYRSSRTRAR